MRRMNRFIVAIIRPRAFSSATSRFEGLIASLDAPNPCVMPGGKLSDGSPSTAGIPGCYSGEVCLSSTQSTPIPHGQGSMIWENGITYEGMWRQGLYHGMGCMMHRNGGGYRGVYRDGLKHGNGASLYGGKWGYDRWEGPFVDDRAHGPGVMYMVDSSHNISFTFEHGNQAGYAPCNEEYEKAVFFRRLSPATTDGTMLAVLEEFGPLDYCYIAKSPERVSLKIGRAKFRPVADATEDGALDKVERILQARQRAVDNAAAACDALDRTLVDGHEIRVEIARPADMNEYTRYGDY